MSFRHGLRLIYFCVTAVLCASRANVRFEICGGNMLHSLLSRDEAVNRRCTVDFIILSLLVIFFS